MAPVVTPLLSSRSDQGSQRRHTRQLLDLATKVLLVTSFPVLKLCSSGYTKQSGYWLSGGFFIWHEIGSKLATVARGGTKRGDQIWNMYLISAANWFQIKLFRVVNCIRLL